MTNFNERTNTFLYKNIISHTLFLKEWSWLCVRHELETWTDCYIDPSSRDHSSTSSSSWLGWFKALSAAGSHSGILSPTNSNSVHLVILLFNVHLLPLFFRLFTQVHLLTDGSVEGQYITQGQLLKWNKSCLNLEYLSSKTGCLPKLNNPVYSTISLEIWEKMLGFMLFLKAFVLSEVHQPCPGFQLELPISYVDNRYVKCDSPDIYTYIYIYIYIFTNPSARAGYDTRSIFKRSLTGLNSEFSFS